MSSLQYLSKDQLFALPIDLEEDMEEENPNADSSDKTTETTPKDDSFENKTNLSKILEYLDEKSIFAIQEKYKMNLDNNSNPIFYTNSPSFITFSTSKENKEIKSLANSSKIYIAEIFRRNWKLKARRLITKMKQKLIKKLNYIETKENENKINCFHNKFYSNTKNNNINNNVVNQCYIEKRNEPYFFHKSSLEPKTYSFMV